MPTTTTDEAKKMAMSDDVKKSSLMARRANAVNKALSIETQKEKLTVAISRRIEMLTEPIKNQYKYMDTIHDGGEQCRIMKVKSNKDGTDYVMKVQQKKRIRGRNEALFRRLTERLMNMPDTTNVVKVYACYEDQHYFYTLLEACKGGDLFDFFRMLCSDDMDSKAVEREVRIVMRELLASLSYLHSQGLVHKDVKLENLVFKEQGGVEPRSPKDKTPKVKTKEPGSPKSPKSPSMLKLIDFDFTEEWEPDSPRSKAVVGTDGYIAPEAYLGNPQPKSDVYSAGVVMYVLIAGRFPHDDEMFDDQPNENYVGHPKMKGIYERLKKAQVRFGKSWDHLPEAKEFCQQLMEFKVHKRMDAAEALLHPWLMEGAPAGSGASGARALRRGTSSGGSSPAVPPEVHHV